MCRISLIMEVEISVLFDCSFVFKDFHMFSMLLKQIEIFSSFPATAVKVFTYLSMTWLILSFVVCIGERFFFHVQLLEYIWFRSGSEGIFRVEAGNV